MLGQPHITSFSDNILQVTDIDQSVSHDEATITKVPVGDLGNNAYVFCDNTSGVTLLVDAAFDVDTLTSAAPTAQLVVTTHCHIDHWMALEEFVNRTQATTFAHVGEADRIPVPTDVILEQGSMVAVGNSALDVVTLRGHRWALDDHVCSSVALVYRNPSGPWVVFTGDGLFPGGVGNTCEDPEAFAALLADVETNIFSLPDDTIVHPGHGESTTVGQQRPQVAQWKERGW